jgi:hypothetical protein
MVRQAHHLEAGRRVNSNVRNSEFETVEVNSLSFPNFFIVGWAMPTLQSTNTHKDSSRIDRSTGLRLVELTPRRELWSDDLGLDE